MRVTLEHSEQPEIMKKSLFWREDILVQHSAYLVKIVVTFTEAEKVLIADDRILNQIIPQEHATLAQYFAERCPLEGCTLSFSTIASAKAFEEGFRTVVQKIRNTLDLNSTSPSNKTFEL